MRIETVGMLALILALALIPGRLPGAETTIAVAANFAMPMRALSAAYERESGHRIRIVTGSSGALFAQIRQGAPFDAFFSADQDKPARLDNTALAAPGSRFTYAIGRLVLWSAEATRPIGDASALVAPGAGRVAIANPRLAPYGLAALSTLRHLGLEGAVRERLVYGENVTQAYQFVSTGNATLGFVAAAQVYADGRLATGTGWLVPADHHAPLRQDALLLQRGADNAATLGLLAFVRGDRARALLPGWGYDLPHTDAAVAAHGWP